MAEQVRILVLLVGLLEELREGLGSLDSQLGVREVQGDQGWDEGGDMGDCLRSDVVVGQVKYL
jgi:hypothetical protein